MLVRAITRNMDATHIHNFHIHMHAADRSALLAKLGGD
jgi:hypothetical protein